LPPTSPPVIYTLSLHDALPILPSPIRPLGRASIARLYPIVLRERAPQVEEVRIERRAPELALFLERFAQVVRERLDVDRWDARLDRKSTRLNSSHDQISYAVFC